MNTDQKKPNVAILLATQRTGTHLLKGAIDSHPLIAGPFSEAFYQDYDSDPANFFHYMLQRAQADPTCMLPHRRIEFFQNYLQDLPVICQKPNIVLDIKYNSVHHVHTVWQAPFETPPLFKVIRNNNYPIIHLLRKNLLKTVVSNMRAQKLKQFQRLSDESADTAVIHVDPQTVLQYLDILKRFHSTIEGFISGYPHVLALYYEDIFLQSQGTSDQTSLNPEPLRQIAALFNLEPNFNLQPLTKKLTSSDLKEAIVNYDELESVLSSTEYARYLD